jgi:ABC-type multidrug transport system fused ATPase/permease subunit
MINLWLTLIIFVIVPVMVLSCMKLNRKMKKAFAAQRYQIGELNARIEDTLLGQKVVKAFTNEDMENQKFDVDNHSFFGIKKETYKYMGAFQTTTRMFDGVMYLAVVVAGGIFMVRGMILPGDLVAYMLYVTTFIATIRRIIEFAEQFQRGMTGIERFLQIMDTKIDIFDEPGAVELKDVTGDITFKDKLLFFKSYDVGNEKDCINVKKLNSKKKIKKYFDMLEFLNPTGENKNMNATISENKNEYIYSFYYIGIGHGDYGLHDMIDFGKKTIIINKSTGKYTTQYETIRTVEGKYNEYPNIFGF